MIDLREGALVIDERALMDKSGHKQVESGSLLDGLIHMATTIGQVKS